MEKKKRSEVFIDYGRQLDIVDPSTLKEEITVIGVGGIGSPTVIVLTKMGCSKVTVYDPDIVENHNLPNQIFRLKDISHLKVKAIKEIVHDFTGIEIKIKPEKFESQMLTGIVICATDNMESRKAAFRKVKYNPRVHLFIDARMGGEVARIYAINPCDPDNIEFYEKNLYTDEEAINERCTAKAIIYNVFSIASLIANLIKRYIRSQEIPKEIILDLVNLNLITT